MRSIFKNNENHVRPGWKITLVFIVSIILTLVVNAVLSLNINSQFLFHQQGFIEIFRISNLYLIIVVCFVVRKLERRPLSTIGLTNPAGHFLHMLTGFLMGAAAIVAVVLLIWMLGNITFNHGMSASLSGNDVLATFKFAILPGIGEELLFRGYFMNILSGSIGRVWAAVVTSVLFSLLHIGNADISMIALLNIIVIGVLLAIMTYRTGSIWMAVFFHISWNLFQGFVFSVPVSGSGYRGILDMQISGNELLTGGGFGLEGGLLTTVMIAVLILIFTPKHLSFKGERRWTA